MASCEFTLEHYREICDAITRHHYAPIFYHEDLLQGTSEKVIILRHDIDQSLERAARLAMVEQEYGLKSTFFLWLRSPFYNVFDIKQSAIIKGILARGHTIGLHFDVTGYDFANGADLGSAVAKEAQALSQWFGVPVRAVSMHRPNPWALAQGPELGGCINAYGHRFFDEYKYLSDSRRGWREGCICGHIENETYQRLHVLMHPLWWSDSEVDGVDTALAEFLHDKLEYLDGALAENISTYHRAKVLHQRNGQVIADEA